MRKGRIVMIVMNLLQTIIPLLEYNSSQIPILCLFRIATAICNYNFQKKIKTNIKLIIYYELTINTIYNVWCQNQNWYCDMHSIDNVQAFANKNLVINI